MVMIYFCDFFVNFAIYFQHALSIPSGIWPMIDLTSLSKASLNDDKSVLAALLFLGMLSRIKPRLKKTLAIGKEM